jgi:hypothetical protein
LILGIVLFHGIRPGCMWIYYNHCPVFWTGRGNEAKIYPKWMVTR